MSVWDDCSAYWPMNEASDVTRSDSVGSWDMADGLGNVSAVTGRLGNGALADGSSSLHATTSPPSALTAGAVSIAGWCRVDTDNNSTTDDVVKITLDSGHTIAIQFDEVANKFVAECVYSTNTVTLTASLVTVSTSTWYHVAVTWTGSIINIYVNGIGPSTDSSSAATIDASQTFSSALFASGKVALDEFGVWDSVLSAADVSDLYNGGAGLAYGAAASAVAFFAFH